MIIPFIIFDEQILSQPGCVEDMRGRGLEQHSLDHHDNSNHHSGALIIFMSKIMLIKTYFQPGCVEDMRGRGLEQRVCDGTVDCPDFSGYCHHDNEKRLWS